LLIRHERNGWPPRRSQSRSRREQNGRAERAERRPIVTISAIIYGELCIHCRSVAIRHCDALACRVLGARSLHPVVGAHASAVSIVTSDVLAVFSSSVIADHRFCEKFHQVDTKTVLITLIQPKNNILFIDVSASRRKPSSGLTFGAGRHYVRACLIRG